MLTFGKSGPYFVLKFSVPARRVACEADLSMPPTALRRDHRTLLAERYFPHASHQVIILSTDTEIDAQFVPMLGDSSHERTN